MAHYEPVCQAQQYTADSQARLLHLAQQKLEELCLHTGTALQCLDVSRVLLLHIKASTVRGGRT